MSIRIYKLIILCWQRVANFGPSIGRHIQYHCPSWTSSSYKFIFILFRLFILVPLWKKWYCLCKSRLNLFLNQPVLSDVCKISCWMKQQELSLYKYHFGGVQTNSWQAFTAPNHLVYSLRQTTLCIHCARSPRVFTVPNHLVCSLRQTNLCIYGAKTTLCIHCAKPPCVCTAPNQLVYSLRQTTSCVYCAKPPCVFTAPNHLVYSLRQTTSCVYCAKPTRVFTAPNHLVYSLPETTSCN